MNSKQESKRSMFLVVEEFVTSSDSAVLALMPQFNVAFDDFLIGLENLKFASEKQISSRLGYRIEKSEQRLIMTDLCLDVSGRVRAYATNTGDSILFEQMNRKRYALDKLNDTLISDYCQQVHDKTQLILADLVTYGVDTSSLGKLQDAISLYLELLPKPRFEIVNRKQETRKIAEAIATCEEKIKVMDILVSMLEFSNTPFYKNYFDNRIVIDTGSRAISFRGLVRNEMGELLKGVKVFIASLNLETITTSKGYFEMKHVPPGVYTASFDKEGLVTQQVPIAISANQRTDVDVVLANNQPMRMVS